MKYLFLFIIILIIGVVLYLYKDLYKKIFWFIDFGDNNIICDGDKCSITNKNKESDNDKKK